MAKMCDSSIASRGFRPQEKWMMAVRAFCCGVRTNSFRWSGCKLHDLTLGIIMWGINRQTQKTVNQCPHYHSTIDYHSVTNDRPVFSSFQLLHENIYRSSRVGEVCQGTSRWNSLSQLLQWSGKKRFISLLYIELGASRELLLCSCHLPR